jgi:transposase
MFVRYKSTPNSDKTAVQLVENIRTGNKVKQKVVRHFGYALNEQEKEALKKLAQHYMLELTTKKRPALFEKDSLMHLVVNGSEKQSDAPLNVNLKDLKEEKRIRLGIHQTYGSLFDQIGFNRIVKNPSRKKATIELMRNIVMTRIAQPASKRHSVHLLENEYGITADVNAVYRMMDLLDDTAIDKIKQAGYAHTMGLLGGKVDVVFYDCTTLYFESFVEDKLKQNGYSKDGKFNQSQVLLAMMVTQSGLPIGYELFAGSTFEGNTLEDALKRLHEKYKIDKLIFVADSALLSKSNIEKFQKLEQPFIVGARIKNLDADTINEVLDTTSYKELTDTDATEEKTTFKEITVKKNNLRLIVTHSPVRAAKDKHDRENALEQVTQRLSKSKKPKALLNNFGYKKFVKVEGQATLSVDEIKVAQEAKWDGLHGIITNIAEEPVQKILAPYKGLWQIEQTFRISKHDLQMRPIFHWNEKRIKAHIAICFMALVCVRSLEYKVHLQYKKLSPAVILSELMRIEASILKDYKTDKWYCIPSQASQHAKKIYQLLDMKWSDTPYIIKRTPEKFIPAK